MNSPEALYCIEHEARELDIACAVRAIAREKYGVNVRLHFLTNELDSAIDRQKIRLVVVPSCTARGFAHQAVLDAFRQQPVLNLACEQLFSPANRHYRMPRDEFSRRHVTHVAAGNFFREWLLEAGVPSEHILMAGSTTFQLYCPPYSQFYHSQREKIASTYGLDGDLPWVLLPENFGAAFFKPSHLRKRIRGGYDRRELEAYVAYARKSFHEIAAWCREAVVASDVELIIRPRPAVSAKVFTDAFLKAAGIGPTNHLHFIKDGNVREWIFASQLVISSYSTTLLEAAVAGKPAYLLSAASVPESAASDWHPFAPNVSNCEAFLELIDGAGRVAPSDRLRGWTQQNLLNYGDAIENVARLVGDICSGAKTVPAAYQPPISALAADRAREGLKRTERFFRERMRPNRIQNFVYERERIDQEQINQRTDLWANLVLPDRAKPAA